MRRRLVLLAPLSFTLLVAALAIAAWPDGAADPVSADGNSTISIDAVEDGDPAADSVEAMAAYGVGSTLVTSVDMGNVQPPGYWGYDLVILMDTNLAFVPTSDETGDTIPESWNYVNDGSHGMSTHAVVNQDGQKLQGGAARPNSTMTTFAGEIVHASFRCTAPDGPGPDDDGTLHLVAHGEAVVYTQLVVVAGQIFADLADAEITCAGVSDDDGDGCVDAEEVVGALPPKPGSTGAFDPLAWYDFYDVPVPARADPAANGVKDGAVSLGDLGAALFYVGAAPSGACGDNPNGNGVDYDCDKDSDGRADGLDYDRTASAAPNPPWDAGPPDGVITMTDLGVVQAQVGLDCSGPP